MTNIANAIRAKLNVDTEYTPPQMSQAINSIQVAVPIQLEEKTVSPSESSAIVTPSTGKDGLSKVTVNAISKTYVGSSVARQAAKTITPSDSSQTAVAAERYTTGAITVSAVPTETKTITTNGTYTASSGKWFKSVTVNIPVGDTINNQANKTVTPSESFQEITPDSGYTGLAKVTVNAIPSEYIIPSGNKAITANGSNIDVKNYATISVNVTIGENSWIVKVEDIKDYDLSAKNPNKNKEEVLREPKEILEDIEKTDNEIKVHIQNLKGLLKQYLLFCQKQI